MKYLIILLSFILVCNTYMYADNTFPYSLKLLNDYPNGALVTGKSDDVYFIKSLILGESDFIYNWKGLNKSNSKAFSIDNTKILDYAQFNSKLLIIGKHFNDIKITVFENNGSILIDTSLGINDDFGYANAEIKDIYNNRMLISINTILFEIEINSTNLKFKKYDLNLIDAFYFKINKQDMIAVACNTQSSAELKLIGADGNISFISTLPAYDEIHLFAAGENILTIAGSKMSKSSFCQIINPQKGIQGEFWVEAVVNNITKLKGTDSPNIAYLNNLNNKYAFTIYDPINKKNIYSQAINENFIEPYGLYCIGQEITAIFRNGIAVFSQAGKKLASDYIPIGEYFPTNFTVGEFKDNIIISSPKFSLSLEKESHPLWYFNTLLRQSSEIILPLILGILLIYIFQIYRHQKRFLDGLLDLKSFGAVFILDKNGKLLRANDSGKELLSITQSMKRKKDFRYFCIKDSTHQLRDLVTISLQTKDAITQKLMLSQGLETKEWIFNILPLRNITGNFRGLVITGIDITEELEKKRLNNWAQLAHDMQTNLSTIKLNAEQLDLDINGDNYSRRTKITHQVNILIQRVRDIVTVGRNNNIDKQVYDAVDICKEVLAEFDSNVFPDVLFQIDAQSHKVVCDKPKIVRALRNAIENGIRSLPDKKGTIKISNSADSKNAYFKISDSGVGMDSKTKDKMLKPYFTTGAKEGGSGIGTMIMQHVMELHGGEIIINSEKGKGTEIIFLIPNYMIASGKQKLQNKLFIRKKVT